VIAWVVMPQVANLPLWCTAWRLAVLIWRGTLAVDREAAARTLVAAGAAGRDLGATLFTHRTLLGRDAGVTLIVVLLALKTLELRARRDAFVVFFLASSPCSPTSSSRSRCSRQRPCWWPCWGC
jgi:hypothetical protein